MNSPSDFLCWLFRKGETSSLTTDLEMFGSKQGLGIKKPKFSSQSSLELASFFRSEGCVPGGFVPTSIVLISFGREAESARACS